MRRRVIVLYSGPGRFMRALDWVFVICLAVTIAAPLIAGMPPNWITVFNAAFAIPIGKELIWHYRMRPFFDDEISLITMAKTGPLPPVVKIGASE